MFKAWNMLKKLKLIDNEGYRRYEYSPEKFKFEIDQLKISRDFLEKSVNNLKFELDSLAEVTGYCRQYIPATGAKINWVKYNAIRKTRRQNKA